MLKECRVHTIHARKRVAIMRDGDKSLYVLQTTNSPPGRRPRVETDQNTDLSFSATHHKTEAIPSIAKKNKKLAALGVNSTQLT